jgi:hypothetical protein
MNEAAELVSELRRRRFNYFVRDGNLVVQPAPDAALLDRLRAHKPEVLALLQGPNGTATERPREAEIDRMVHADGWIPSATPAEALAHDLMRLSIGHNLNLHAMPDGILIEVTGAAWREVVNAFEDAEYHHAI